jgi:hypothetical protein
MKNMHRNPGIRLQKHLTTTLCTMTDRGRQE